MASPLCAAYGKILSAFKNCVRVLPAKSHANAKLRNTLFTHAITTSRFRHTAPPAASCTRGRHLQLRKERRAAFLFRQIFPQKRFDLRVKRNLVVEVMKPVSFVTLDVFLENDIVLF